MSSAEGLRVYEFVSKDAMVISTSLFSGLATLANLFLMITILASPTLRTSSKHILILVLCLTDLYKGIFEFPLIAEYYSLEKWIHDISLLNAVDSSIHFLMIPIRITLMIAICVNCILSMTTRNKSLLVLLSVSMIVCSLGYSLVFVLPVTETPDPLDSCYGYVWQTKNNVLSIGGFFSLALVMVVLVMDISIMFCSFRMFSNESKKFPIDVILGCVLILVFTIPTRIVFAYYSVCTDRETCRTTFLVRAFTTQWKKVRPCLMPFVWLLCQETRLQVKKLWCCVREGPTNHVTGYTHENGDLEL